MPVPAAADAVIDVYDYPATFLRLPRLARLAAPDFWRFRRFWFALNLAGVIGGLVAIARRLDAGADTQAVWLVPPFLPHSGALPSSWLATLIAAIAWRRPGVRALAVAGWLVLAMHPGQGSLTSPIVAVLTCHPHGRLTASAPLDGPSAATASHSAKPLLVRPTA